MYKSNKSFANFVHAAPCHGHRACVLIQKVLTMNLHNWRVGVKIKINLQGKHRFEFDNFVRIILSFWQQCAFEKKRLRAKM